MLGVFTVAEAIDIAKSNGLDLVEISPNANPPVCRIDDFGKYRYKQQKIAKATKKKHGGVKEIKISPNIAANDVETKVSKTVAFLQKGYRVKIFLLFRGREISHNDLGYRVLNDFKDSVIEKLDGKAKVESDIHTEGRGLSMTFVPGVTK